MSLLKKEEPNPLGVVDSEILCLFPSLDFNRPNVHANSKERMKSLLAVLSITAKKGSITKYDLTNWKSQDNNGFRFGGQTAQDVITELEDLKLLRTIEKTSEKNRPKKERVLTAKGVLACLAMPEFQQTSILSKILKSTYLKDSELGLLLKIYNDGFVRRSMEIDRKKISTLSVLTREFGCRGYNLELKTETAIINDLRASEENGFIEDTKFSLADVTSVLFDFVNANDEDSQQDKRELIELLNNSLSDEHQSVSMEERVKTAQQMGKFFQGLLNFFGPEFLSWFVEQKRRYSKADIHGLTKEAQKKLVAWGVDETMDFGDRSEYVARAVREVAVEQLQKMNV